MAMIGGCKQSVIGFRDRNCVGAASRGDFAFAGTLGLGGAFYATIIFIAGRACIDRSKMQRTKRLRFDLKSLRGRDH